jgi:hypothetical protein
VKTIQIILDVEVSDDELSAKTVLGRWQHAGAYPELMPGVRVVRAVSLPLTEPAAAPVPGSIADWPNVSARLVNAARNAGILTVVELGRNLPQLRMFRGVGDGLIKEAIRICVDARAPFNPDELEISPRTYAQQLLREQPTQPTQTPTA